MKLKIGITRREYINVVDGVNRFVFTLADGLSSLGHDVHVISYSFRDIQRSEMSAYIKNVFGYQGSIYTLTEEATILNWPKLALTWLVEGSKLVDRLGLDAVILSGVVPLWTKALKIAANHGIYAGDFTHKKSLRQLLFLQVARNLYKHSVDLCFCCSSQLQREITELIGVGSVLVPLPVNLQLFRSEPVHRRDSTVVHVGTRINKNAELSVRSIEILTQKMNVDAKLVIVGSSTPYIEKLMSRYKHLVPKHLEFVGPYPLFSPDKKTIPDILAHSRAFILPSKHEGLPYSVLEAFASGLPVVVSNAVPSDMVLDGFNGFRVGDFDPNLFAQKLAILFTNDILWTKISKNALKTSRSYDHIKIAKYYETALKRLKCTS